MKMCKKCGYQDVQCAKVQGQHCDSPVGGRDQLLQALRSSTCSESMSIKTGQRKHILGELQRSIDQLEQEKTEEDDNSQEFSEHENSEGFLMELFHLKLVGEVFSPDRFVSGASKFGLQPGQAFDLRLGHQFFCAKQRRKCIEHDVTNPYGLVVVTPPCTVFPLLQYLGLGKSKGKL